MEKNLAVKKIQGSSSLQNQKVVSKINEVITKEKSELLVFFEDCTVSKTSFFPNKIAVPNLLLKEIFKNFNK